MTGAFNKLPITRSFEWYAGSVRKDCVTSCIYSIQVVFWRYTYQARVPVVFCCWHHQYLCRGPCRLSDKRPPPAPSCQ